MAILAASITPGVYSLLAWYFERINRREMTQTVFSAFVLVGSFLYLLGLYLFPYIVESMGKGYLNESFNWAMAKFGLFVWIGVLIFIGMYSWALNLFRWRRQKNSGERIHLFLQVFFLGISILPLCLTSSYPIFQRKVGFTFRTKRREHSQGMSILSRKTSSSTTRYG
jgi:cytochrome bd-type quinol oxidase subunit 2